MATLAQEYKKLWSKKGLKQDFWTGLVLLICAIWLFWKLLLWFVKKGDKFLSFIANKIQDKIEELPK